MALDLLLAKRRILVLFPFSLIQLSLSIIILVYSAIVEHRLSVINKDYIIERNNYTYKINNVNDDIVGFCSNFYNNMLKTNNFSIIFQLNENENQFNILLDSVSVCMAFSITSISFLCIFLLILFCGFSTFGIKSDEKLRENSNYEPNKKHCGTTCLMITKLLTFFLIKFYLIIYSIISLFKIQNLFDGIYKYQENCIIDLDKNKFKNNYINCWRIKRPLNIYSVFALLFVISDIIELILLILTKNYNVYSLILNKFSCGKYKYEKVDDNKGFIIPQNKVVKDDKMVEDSETNELPEEIIGAINESRDSSLIDKNFI